MYLLTYYVQLHKMTHFRFCAHLTFIQACISGLNVSGIHNYRLEYRSSSQVRTNQKIGWGEKIQFVELYMHCITEGKNSVFFVEIHQLIQCNIFGCIWTTVHWITARKKKSKLTQFCSWQLNWNSGTWFVMSTHVFFPASKCEICHQKWMYCCPLLRYASRVCESKTPGQRKKKW